MEKNKIQFENLSVEKNNHGFEFNTVNEESTDLEELENQTLEATSLKLESNIENQQIIDVGVDMPMTELENQTQSTTKVTTEIDTSMNEISTPHISSIKVEKTLRMDVENQISTHRDKTIKTTSSEVSMNQFEEADLIFNEYGKSNASNAQIENFNFEMDLESTLEQPKEISEELKEFDFSNNEDLNKTRAYTTEIECKNKIPQDFSETLKDSEMNLENKNEIEAQINIDDIMTEKKDSKNQIDLVELGDQQDIFDNFEFNESSIENSSVGGESIDENSDYEFENQINLENKKTIINQNLNVRNLFSNLERTPLEENKVETKMELENKEVNVINEALEKNERNQPEISNEIPNTNKDVVEQLTEMATSNFECEKPIAIKNSETLQKFEKTKIQSNVKERTTLKPIETPVEMIEEKSIEYENEINDDSNKMDEIFDEKFEKIDLGDVDDLRKINKFHGLKGTPEDISQIIDQTPLDFTKSEQESKSLETEKMKIENISSQILHSIVTDSENMGEILIEQNCQMRSFNSIENQILLQNLSPIDSFSLNSNTMETDNVYESINFIELESKKVEENSPEVIASKEMNLENVKIDSNMQYPKYVLKENVEIAPILRKSSSKEIKTMKPNDSVKVNLEISSNVTEFSIMNTQSMKIIENKESKKKSTLVSKKKPKKTLLLKKKTKKESFKNSSSLEKKEEEENIKNRKISVALNEHVLVGNVINEDALSENEDEEENLNRKMSITLSDEKNSKKAQRIEEKIEEKNCSLPFKMVPQNSIDITSAEVMKSCSSKKSFLSSSEKIENSNNVDKMEADAEKVANLKQSQIQLNFQNFSSKKLERTTSNFECEKPINLAIKDSKTSPMEISTNDNKIDKENGKNLIETSLEMKIFSAKSTEINEILNNNSSVLNNNLNAFASDQGENKEEMPTNKISDMTDSEKFEKTKVQFNVEESSKEIKQFAEISNVFLENTTLKPIETPVEMIEEQKEEYGVNKKGTNFIDTKIPHQMIIPSMCKLSQAIPSVGIGNKNKKQKFTAEEASFLDDSSSEEEEESESKNEEEEEDILSMEEEEEILSLKVFASDQGENKEDEENEEANFWDLESMDSNSPASIKQVETNQNAQIEEIEQQEFVNVEPTSAPTSTKNEINDSNLSNEFPLLNEEENTENEKIEEFLLTNESTDDNVEDKTNESTNDDCRCNMTAMLRKSEVKTIATVDSKIEENNFLFDEEENTENIFASQHEKEKIDEKTELENEEKKIGGGQKEEAKENVSVILEKKEKKNLQQQVEISSEKKTQVDKKKNKDFEELNLFEINENELNLETEDYINSSSQYTICTRESTSEEELKETKNVNEKESENPLETSVEKMTERQLRTPPNFFTFLQQKSNSAAEVKKKNNREPEWASLFAEKENPPSNKLHASPTIDLIDGTKEKESNSKKGIKRNSETLVSNKMNEPPKKRQRLSSRRVKRIALDVFSDSQSSPEDDGSGKKSEGAKKSCKGTPCE